MGAPLSLAPAPPVTHQQRSGLIVFAVAGGVFLFACLGVLALVVLRPGYDARAEQRAKDDEGKRVGLVDEEAVRRARDGGKVAPKTDPKPKAGDRISIAGVVVGLGSGADDFFDAADGKSD